MGVKNQMEGISLKKISYVLFSIIFLIALTACSSNQTTTEKKAESKKSSDKPIELSYAFFAPANTFPAVQMEQWKKELEKRTNGKVKINLFHGGTLLEANNMYDGVKDGVADIGLSSTTYEPGKFPLLAISDMPSNYKNAKAASKTVYELVKKYPPEAFKDQKIITVFATEPAYIQSKDKIASLKDLKGKQLRIAGATTNIMEKLGAAPVGMSQAEVPEALQTGVIKGYVSSREILKDLKLAESAKYVTDYPLTLYTFVAVMNKDKWDSLPKDVQKVIDELSEEMMLFAGDYLDKHVKESLDWSKKDQNVEVVSLTDKDDWDKKLSNMQQEYVNKTAKDGLPAKEYLKDMKALIEKYNKE